MRAPPPPRLLPPIPTAVRFLVAGAMLAAMVYVVFGLGEGPEPTADEPRVEPVVAVPILDRAVLGAAGDDTRERRLQLEPEPLRHLLALAIDVGPTVAAALGAPEEAVPLKVLRADMPTWRGRWLWYEGTLEDLQGPREGHPLAGYSIYEATIRLADGGHAIAAFSIPPEDSIRRGAWVRLEGYLLKLRDTTYPLDLRQAPMLVGRSIQRDYEDWGGVHALDAAVLATIDDSSYWPGDKMWHTLEDDQTEALWHLAAFARDTTDRRTFGEWRQLPALNAAEFFDRCKDGQLERGLPLRIIGTLIWRTTLAAPANPAGIKFWTVAWVQVREYGGATVPIWVPRRVGELPLRAQLEVRAHYYRRFAYEASNGERRFVPLFVAADLDPFVLGTDPTMRLLGLVLGGILTGLMLLLWWSQRRAERDALQHQRAMDDRRRRRRERAAARTASSSSP
ncbi:MAG: hypothetical protein KF830_02815 [Planctomycetes bacterium]|nr:hypothetical protein [Planctomycetota bacterium]